MQAHIHVHVAIMYTTPDLVERACSYKTEVKVETAIIYFESGLESAAESDVESGLESDAESGLESDLDIEARSCDHVYHVSRALYAWNITSH